MATKPGSRPKNEFVFFDVVYEDGSQRSNRRVPAELLGGLEKDEPARGFIIEQDRDIAEKSGRAPLAIKSIRRTGAKVRRCQAGTKSEPGTLAGARFSISFSISFSSATIESRLWRSMPRSRRG